MAQITDSKGRAYDSSPIRLDYVLPSAEEIRREFERERDLLDLRKCECHRNRLINTQKTLHIGIGVLGLAGTIASAGAGSLVAVIVSGGVTTGGMFVNEFANEKEIEKLGKDFIRLKEVETLYRSMPDCQFDPGAWNRQRFDEYQTLKAQIAAERAKLSKDFAPPAAKTKNSKNTAFLKRADARAPPPRPCNAARITLPGQHLRHIPCAFVGKKLPLPSPHNQT